MLTRRYGRPTDGLRRGSVRRLRSWLHARLWRAGIVFAATLLLAGCSTAGIERTDFVPEALVATAEPAGLKGVRAWGDDPLPLLETMKSVEGPKLHDVMMERKGSSKAVVANMLALSGGGEDGAFGAGLLIGWGERGDRPEFDLVTGISAGALLAPFALLGRDFDKQLADIFTNHSGAMIYETDVVGGLLGGSAITKTDPLKMLIDHYVDRRLMTRLAAERAKGRLLIIGTTNLDAQRPVYWDIGKIAQSGKKEALELMRLVLLASASIPGLFPPVRIPVTAGGKTYEELHVDGGTSNGIFFSLSGVSLKEIDKAIGMKVKRRLYAVRNGKLGAEWKPVKAAALDIGQRSLSTIIRSQAIGDLARIHASTIAEGVEFNLAYIPDSFKGPEHKPFDMAYTKPLFELGRKLGREGYPWAKKPPVVTAGGTAN